MAHTSGGGQSRTLVLTAGILTLVLGSNCGSSPSSPTAPSAIPIAITSGAAGAPLSFAAGVVADLASCLGADQNPACFSATRITGLAAAEVTAPTAPNNLVATVTGNTVTLTWAAPASVDPVVTYILEAGSSPGAANLANFTTGTTATSFVAVGVAPGTFYVRVRSQNAGGASAASQEVVIVVGTSGCTSAPNPPTGLVAAVSGTTVTLTWSAPAAGCTPTGYVLQAGSSSGLSNLANFSTGSPATSFVAPGTPAGTYYLRVLAAHASGRSTASNEAVATVGTSTGRGTVDQVYLPQPFPTGARSCGNTENNSVAQTFTVGRSGLLSAVELDVVGGGGARPVFPHVLVQIRRTSAGVVTSEILGQVTIRSLTAIHRGGADIVLTAVDLSGLNIRVQAGDRLAIVLPIASVRSNAAGWCGSGSGYPGGASFTDGGGSGVFRFTSGLDLFFRTYVSN
jgi:hypothetical protein